MSNPFERLQAAVFAATTTAFGYDAAWTPSSGGAEQTARIHFREPTEKEKLGPVVYTPVDYFAEWYVDVFPGLFDAVRAGRLETLTISEVDYLVRTVHKAHDGKTYQAHLERTTV